MTAVYTLVAKEQADPARDWSVTEMCRVLEVSRSGFYDWQTRGPSARELEDRVLAREIELVPAAHGPGPPARLPVDQNFCGWAVRDSNP